jgi:hypothetical protein
MASSLVRVSPVAVSVSSARRMCVVAKALKLRVRQGASQPHARSTLFVINEFHSRLFEGAADGLIIGPRKRGRARRQFGATDRGYAHRRVAGEVFGAPADRRPGRSNSGHDGKSSRLAARTPLARPQTPAVDHGNASKEKLLDAVRLDIARSAHLRDRMLGELNAIGSEDAATKWAQRRLAEKNKLNVTDAKHVEEAFRAKLKSFAIHHAEGVPDSKTDATNSSTTDRAGQKARSETPSSPVDKSVLLHPEPRRIRDREHVRFVSQQTCLVCGRQPCDAHHLRFAQNRALGRKASDEFTVPLCRGHHREVHRHGDEATWWQQLGLDPAGTARALWLETHRHQG